MKYVCAGICKLILTSLSLILTFLSLCLCLKMLSQSLLELYADICDWHFKNLDIHLKDGRFGWLFTGGFPSNNDGQQPTPLRNSKIPVKPKQCLNINLKFYGSIPDESLGQFLRPLIKMVSSTLCSGGRDGCSQLLVRLLFSHLNWIAIKTQCVNLIIAADFESKGQNCTG